jgi:hypothetical protein
MPKSFVVAPHLLHFGHLRLSALAGACRVMLRFSGWMVAGVQQESLEAFDKFITAGQMRPGSFKVEKLCLPCCIDRLLGAPLRAHSIPRYVGSVSEASHGPAFEVNESRFTATCQ